MDVYFTEKFKKQYQKVPPFMRKKIDRQLHFLIENPQHPSLQTRKLLGNIWYCRIDRNYRMTFNWEGKALLLRNVDMHDQALSNP